jgi:glutaconyl-CoA/methylmalonyl-CoA decarboxylase subunit gamma
MKKVNVIVNGTSYEVEVGDLNASPIAVSVNGKSYEVSLEGKAAPAPVKTAVPVKAPVPAPAAAPAATAGGNTLVAPMPGVIHKVLVKPGDTVTRGQEICYLEAMKMKNIIRAPKDGVIASVEVQNEQKVVFGAVIIRYA